jgi:hypothetical protein
MGWSDEDAFRITFHLNTVVGPSNSCTADADFLLGKRGHGMGLTELGSCILTISEASEILTTLTSLYHQLLFPTPTPSFSLSLSQVNLLCIPLSSCCAPEL